MRALRIAVPVLLAVTVPAAEGRAAGVVELPAPAGATRVEPVAMRLVVTPERRSADPAVHEAHLVMTLLAPEDAAETLRLRFPRESADSLVVTRLGSPVALSVPGSDGSDPAVSTTPTGPPEAAIRLAAGEAAVIEARWRVAATTLPGIAADEAGWWGRTRGPLLQPVHRLRVEHPRGSALASGGLEVVIEPAGHPLVSGVLADVGARYSEGRVAWAVPMLSAGESLELTWPALETESVLPRDAAEARELVRDWSGERAVAPDEIALVRAGLLALHGLPFRKALSDEASARLLTSTARPGWAPTTAPLSEDEQEALQVLTAFEDRLREPASRLARATPPPPAAEPPTATTVPPPSGIAAEPPTGSDRAPQSARRERAAAAPPESMPRTEPRTDGAAPPITRTAPTLVGFVDDDPLVTVPPDRSWREEVLFATTASIPADHRDARRAIERVERADGGLSRAVLQREAIAARHGKQWAPGYVADFFSRQAWYEPNPDYGPELLGEDEREAWEILDLWIDSLAEPAHTRVAEARPTESMAGVSPSAPADRPALDRLERPRSDGSEWATRAPAKRAHDEPTSSTTLERVTIPERTAESSAPQHRRPESHEHERAGRPERPARVERADEHEPAAADAEAASRPGPFFQRPRSRSEREPWARTHEPDALASPALRAGGSTQDSIRETARDGASVPWIRDARGARLFLVQERSRGLDPARVELAIATIEARHGRPFEAEPTWRRHFERFTWYAPEPGWNRERLATDAREAIHLLRRAR